MNEESQSVPPVDPAASGFWAEVLERLACRKGAFGRYRLEEEIAQGGQGAILRVWDEDLRRQLAMKVLHEKPESLGGQAASVDPRSLGRFLEEAQVTGQLDHPGIVPIHELGLDARGRVYFTMKLVKGRNLKEVYELVARAEEGWTRTRALSVLLRVCEAMAYAHHKGVVHRDLKPANVMVGRFGEVFVMDWGLARVLGRADQKDVRIAPQLLTAELVSERHERALAEPDSPLLTLDGHIVGTPAYMSPEQARGDVDQVGPPSDVYAVGAMLYHLLAGHLPYVKPGRRISNYAIWYRVQEGPPEPLAERAADVPMELIAICEKAMARDLRDRYADMGALAADLSAFLEHRVVAAFETGALVELKKWVERNRSLAASIAVAFLALVAGFSASLVFKGRSDRNAVLARENEHVAKQRADDVLRLSALQRLDDLTAEADRLWPAHPQSLDAYQAWLSEAQQLVAELPAQEQRLAELRPKGVLRTVEERTAHAAQHPLLLELEQTKRFLEHHRRLRAALEASSLAQEPTAQEVGVDLARLPATAEGINDLAWDCIDPEREDWGREAQGLVLARRALELAATLAPEQRAGIHDTLAWALFANGRFDEAVAESETALEEAPVDRQEEYRGYVERLLSAIEAEIDPAREEERARRHAELEQRIARLELEVSPLPEWSFADPKDKWWHNQLEKLVGRLKDFSDPEHGLAFANLSSDHGWGIQRRAEFARTIGERSVSGEQAAARWSEAVASIASVEECPQYGGLRLPPQLGLLPIGRDPRSGLWEFAHQMTGEPVRRGADGKLVLGPQTGLVFVLLPRGTFLIGAQVSNPNARNYDPLAGTAEGPVREVTLAPFFLSKYEMTQGQWESFVGENPSTNDPGTNPGGKKATLLHPVEQVSWSACAETLTRLGLSLPTEEQWEYAARAGTSSAWWTGDDERSLEGAANLADSFCKRNGGPSGWAFEEWLDDGYTVHAPVGTLDANPFGLHDVCGNVWEWCRDRYGDYWSTAPVGDGASAAGGSSDRVLRGGGFSNLALEARSSNRATFGPEYASHDLGLRPARSVTR